MRAAALLFGIVTVALVFASGCSSDGTGTVARDAAVGGRGGSEAGAGDAAGGAGGSGGGGVPSGGDGRGEGGSSGRGGAGGDDGGAADTSGGVDGGSDMVAAIEGGMVDAGTIGTGDVGGEGTDGSCAEPVPCEGYGDGPDAGLTAVITCLSPGVAPANTPLFLNVFGHHLASQPGGNAIVTLGAGVALNGVPVTACHLTVQVPANAIATPRQTPVVVSPGGWIRASAAVPLIVQ